jgi:hypothetical protein
MVTLQLHTQFSSTSAPLLLVMLLGTHVIAVMDVCKAVGGSIVPRQVVCENGYTQPLFTNVAAPCLDPQDEEPVVSSMYRRRIADGYSSTAPGRTGLSALHATAVRGGSSGMQQQVSGEAPKWGYLRLTSFSQNAAEETKHAIQSLEVGGRGEWAGNLVLNPGSLVVVFDFSFVWLLFHFGMVGGGVW